MKRTPMTIRHVAAVENARRSANPERGWYLTVRRCHFDPDRTSRHIEYFDGENWRDHCILETPHSHSQIHVLDEALFGKKEEEKT